MVASKPIHTYVCIHVCIQIINTQAIDGVCGIELVIGRGGKVVYEKRVVVGGVVCVFMVSLSHSLFTYDNMIYTTL